MQQRAPGVVARVEQRRQRARADCVGELGGVEQQREHSAGGGGVAVAAVVLVRIGGVRISCRQGVHRHRRQPGGARLDGREQRRVGARARQLREIGRAHV